MLARCRCVTHFEDAQVVLGSPVPEHAQAPEDSRPPVRRRRASAGRHTGEDRDTRHAHAEALTRVAGRSGARRRRGDDEADAVHSYIDSIGSHPALVFLFVHLREDVPVLEGFDAVPAALAAPLPR
jgi:hypothetical protein